MKVVELRDAVTGKLYRVHPDDVTLITENGGDGTSCVLTLAGKRLIVQGTTAELLKQMSEAVR